MAVAVVVVAAAGVVVVAAIKIGASSPRHQRGAAAVFAALALVSLLTVVGIAIDLSRFYFAQRDLQRMTNVAALDAARVAGGCLGVPANPQAAALTEVNQSVLRNGGKAEYVTNGSVLFGRMLKDSVGVRSFSTGSAQESSAVQVILKKPAPGRLIPLPGVIDNEITLKATAAAQSRPLVSLHVGSSLVSLNNLALNNVLSGLLGNNVNVPSFAGLQGQSVRLGDLVDASGMSATDFFATNRSLQSLLDLLRTSVSSTADSATLAAISTLRNAAKPSLNVKPGDVVQIPSGYEDLAQNASVNALQFVNFAAQTANGSLVNLPLGLSVPGVASVAASLNLVNPGHITVVPAGDLSTYASYAEGLLTLNLNLVNAVTLHLFVQLAPATAQVDDIRCARRGVPVHTIDVHARTSIARIGIGNFDINTINSPSPTVTDAPLVNLLGIGVSAHAYVDVGSGQDVDMTFTGPPFPTPTQHIGVPLGAAFNNVSHQLTDPNYLNITLTPQPLGLLAGLVKAALNTVLGLLTPILDSILTTLVDPLLGALGVELGAADITVEDVSNDQPYLFINSR